MTSSDSGISRKYLKPGDIFYCSRPTLVSTVLGSCVSITMYSRRLKVGGISHGMLPVCGIPDCIGQCTGSFRYVGCSIHHMHQWFIKQGAIPSEIEVKLFGGADLMSASALTGAGVGEQNIAAALKTISSLMLQVAVSDVGGAEGRKIIFDSYTGSVLLKRVRKITQPHTGPVNPSFLK